MSPWSNEYQASVPELLPPAWPAVGIVKMS
jgi:hypothetical protein